nr:MAG TPA: hypothetical protein [Caudoviricetes sp.]
MGNHLFYHIAPLYFLFWIRFIQSLASPVLSSYFFYTLFMSMFPPPAARIITYVLL